jgi:prepilin-type N-terminal cleavage/methylation domain-containing protein
MRKLGFSLIELIIVVLIIGVVSFLVIKLPSFYFSADIADMLSKLSPNGEITVYKDGKISSNKKVDFNCKNIEVYLFKNGEFQKAVYDKENEKEVLFKYSVHNGIGESLILNCDNKWYVFKPFKIIKADSFKEAKDKFLNKKYFPKEGSYY